MIIMMIINPHIVLLLFAFNSVSLLITFFSDQFKKFFIICTFNYLFIIINSFNVFQLPQLNTKQITQNLKLFLIQICLIKNRKYFLLRTKTKN